MNERELFIAALHINDAAQRAAYLDQACGSDNTLRESVDALLAAHAQPASVLERPLAANLERSPAGTEPGPATAGSEEPASDVGETVSYQQEPQAPPSLIGSIIAGRYKLRQEIGEGGMGSVYLAEQMQPVKRQVALKLIKPGMDSAAVLARFESERQALALMDHPHIAKVFDAGTTENGRPYFVMELLSGIPLTEYCDQHRVAAHGSADPVPPDLLRRCSTLTRRASSTATTEADEHPGDESHDAQGVPKGHRLRPGKSHQRIAID